MTAPAGVSMSARLSGLRAELTHGPSGTVIVTVPPTDNGGDGSSFSPTDLFSVSIATCALTTMALQAAREGLSWGDATAEVVKVMAGPPRRVGQVSLRFAMPAGVKAEHRSRLETIARECPVMRSIHPELQVPMSFSYP
ncbi:MAG: OsmC family protein [Archangium sp.]|nr:OsmC family protein [Archangium sp.]